MKIQNVIRNYAVVMGVAGALLLAGSVSAQEITNTEWPDGANVSAPAQTTAGPAADDLTLAPATTSAVNAAAKDAKPAVSEEAAVSPLPVGEGWLLTMLLAFFAMFSLYAWVASRRSKGNLESHVRQADGRVALS